MSQFDQGTLQRYQAPAVDFCYRSGLRPFEQVTGSPEPWIRIASDMHRLSLMVYTMRQYGIEPGVM